MASYNYKAPPLKQKQMTLERVDKFISSTYFTDVNLQARLLSKTIDPAEILHYTAKGRFEFETAKDASYLPVNVGDSIGPLWSTHWFRVKFTVPADLVSELAEDEEVLFYWNTGSEATIWDEHSRQPIGAFTCAEPHDNVREYYPVTSLLKASNCLDFLIEVACNKVLGEGVGSFIGPPDNNVTYTLRKCCLSIRNRKVYTLLRDLQLLHDIAKELEDQERGFVALYTANEIVNMLQLASVKGYDRAIELSDQYFQQGNGSGQHVIHSVGHCHMDCAWLWPYDETKRKCARSWSATLDLMDRYPDWTFACSSAQQYEWIQVNYPQLFERIRESVRLGRFIPVGGSWVEMDGYLPCGEAMCRQMLYGQRYFQREFGVQCTEFWLPDTFGYSVQLPQIMRHFGMKRFFTQKISWSLFNKFPHHTFFWKGLDGSSVLSHFAPGDSYHMEAKVGEFVKTVRNYEDKGRSARSLFLFGHGDGGQGPTQDMLENLNRLKDVDGLPRVELSTPDKFFSGIEEKDSQNLCTWSGELYLEMHNGTYTTQSKIKWYNRRCESLLHSLEFLATLAYVLELSPYPFDQLDSMWKKVLLNQFHDVLPGSSVEIVNNDAKKIYKEVLKSGGDLWSELVQRLGSQKVEELCVCNPLGWPRTALVAVDTNMVDGTEVLQEDLNGRVYQLVNVSGYSIGPSTPADFFPVRVERSTNDSAADVIIMSNGRIYAELDGLGRISVLKAACSNGASGAQAMDVYGRNLLSGAANQLTLYDDIPLFWDAWDVMGFHQETRRPLNDVICAASIKEEGPLRGSVEVSIKISDQSYIRQTIILDAETPYLRVDCEVHWHENRKFLKVEFPLDIVSDHVTYESQFGHIRRPTHRNTSWDSAKYEVCCQKWMDLSDHSGGVAVLNESKYGCSVTDSSTLSLSLLRSPKAPDANADMGSHNFAYALMPHQGSFQEAGVIQSAHNLNSPVITLGHSVSGGRESMFTPDQPSVIIDTIKAAECDRTLSGSKSIILRCYESYGGHYQTRIYTTLPSATSVALCDGLENEIEDIPLVDGNSFMAPFTPFQLKTFKIVIG